MNIAIGGASFAAFLGLVVKVVLVYSAAVKSEREGRIADQVTFATERATAVAALVAADLRTQVERDRADKAEVREDEERQRRIKAENQQAEMSARVMHLEGELKAVKDELARVSSELAKLVAQSSGGGPNA